LLSDGIDAQEAVEVETTTVADELERMSAKKNATCALWIDVEGAEAEVFRGLERCRAAIVVIHVECATRPRWREQKSMIALGEILEKSFVNLGHNSTFWRGWGDAVFISKAIMQAHRAEVANLRRISRQAWLYYILKRILHRLSLKS
jgi:hypothetical protein